MARLDPPIASRWVLYLKLPGGNERVIPLDRAVLHVGSAIDSDLVLEATDGVSANHCTLKLSGGNYILLDHGAKNGCFVNSERCVQPTPLRDGDRIGVGTCVLELRSSAQPSAPTGPSGHLLPSVPMKFSADDRHGAALERIAVYAREWESKRRPRRLLLGRADRRLLSAWLKNPTVFARIRGDPLLGLYVDTSLRVPIIRALLAFWITVVAVVAWILGPADPGEPPDPEPPDPVVTTGDDSSGDPAPGDLPGSEPKKLIKHVRIPGETLADVASLYKVSRAELERSNQTASWEPAPGTTLEVYTSLPAIVRQEEKHIVKQGESWATLSEEFSVGIDSLKAFNPDIRTLKIGDILSVWVEIEQFHKQSSANIPIFRFPKGSIAGEDWLENAVQLVPSEWLEVRCAANAYGTDHTMTKLLEALAIFRSTTGYTGQIMIGDISRIRGGQYKRHKSHRTGRDIDIWLLPKDGRYRQGCPNCSTNSCRPEPDTEVDWEMTWRFVLALDSLRMKNAKGVEVRAVEMIFLSTPQQRDLLAAARLAKADQATQERIIQVAKPIWPPKLVRDEPGHNHHMHVRFFCGPDDPICE